MKVLILKGLPASGKSTWAKEYCKKNTDWIRVNRDDLRNMRGEYNLPKQEKLISKWERLIISETLKSQKNVVIDSTNLNPKHLKSLKEYISLEFENIRFETKNFNTSLEECIRRDLKRVNSVGESVIRDMHSRFLDEITDYEIKQDSSLEKCIIVDIDGTLAKMKNRTPFEWHKVKNDLPKQPIIELVKLYKNAGNKIFVFTGRDGSCEQITRDWLFEHNIPFDELYIRPLGNTEKDSVIKSRFYYENIKGYYYVDIVLDDRNQVVDMWRKELGLTCLQVDYGDF